MKKTIWSLAALMLMAAPMMTSCSNDLDEVAPVEETKSNVVTITIAPPVAEPETRVAMGGTKGLTITGWEEGDEVTLYKATLFEERQYPEKSIPAHFTGEGVAFTCTNASTGQFSGTLPAGESIDDYNLAIFGGTAENYNDGKGGGGINIKPIKWSSNELKDVVMMGAYKDDASFTMEVINNVLKIENATAEDITVAWYGFDYGTSDYGGKSQLRYFELASQFSNTWQSPWVWKGHRINFQEHKDATNVPTFILAKNAVNYVNFPMIYGYTGDNDKIGLYKTDGKLKQDGTLEKEATAVVTMKFTNGRLDSGFSSTKYRGHLLNAGTYNGTAL